MNIDIIKIEINNREIEFIFRPKSGTDFAVIRQVLFNQSYAMDRFARFGSIEKLFNNILTQDKIPIILDAGANIGASSVWFASVFSDSLVVAIEPEIRNLVVLKANAKGRNIIVVEGAVSPSSRPAFLEDPGLGDWGFRVSETGSGYPVTTYTINDLLGTNENNVPFICKLDIEGGENELFGYNNDWVKLFPIIIVELHDWMFPGQALSRNFYNLISKGNYDVIIKGELVFALNNDLLGL